MAHSSSAPPAYAQVRAFVATIRPATEPMPTLRPPSIAGENTTTKWWTIRAGRLQLWCRPRQGEPRPDGLNTLLLGDDAEWRDATGPNGLQSIANGVPIHVDEAGERLTMQSSIVGLPPVFIHEGPQGVAVASDLFLLATLPHINLQLDPAGVEELARIGHPVDHKTLFADTRLAPAGHRIVLDANGLRLQQTWQFGEPDPSSWERFVEAQMNAFEEAVRRINVSRSFLSLTAGLDTRTIFGALAHQQRMIPAVTMSGERPSLDARTAAKLCQAYGVSHQVVTFGREFTGRMPQYVERAALLTGGLSGVEQASEAYFYTQLTGEFAGRLSGNLGNQIGRGGTEGMSVRGADGGVLSADLRKAALYGNGNGAGSDRDEHWLLQKLEGGGTSALSFVLQQEVPFTLVGNYGVGNYYAVQQTPYSSRALVETLRLRPVAELFHASTKSGMWLQDLRHRFFGEPLATCFQRALLKRHGGFAATYPINFGWRASGGVSPAGMMVGAATLVGLVLEKTEVPGLATLVAHSSIGALHNFQRPAEWLRRHLQVFARDTLGSSEVRQSGLFEPATLDRVVDDHFTARGNHQATVTLALDLALAHRFFCRGASS